MVNFNYLICHIFETWSQNVEWKNMFVHVIGTDYNVFWYTSTLCTGRISTKHAEGPGFNFQQCEIKPSTLLRKFTYKLGEGENIKAH